MFTVSPRELAAGDQAPWDVTLRVESESRAAVEAPGVPAVGVDLRRWGAPHPRRAVRVIAAGDRVTARDVLRVAFRLRERRTRVFLGW